MRADERPITDWGIIFPDINYYRTIQSRFSNAIDCITPLNGASINISLGFWFTFKFSPDRQHNHEMRLLRQMCSSLRSVCRTWKCNGTSWIVLCFFFFLQSIPNMDFKSMVSKNIENIRWTKNTSTFTWRCFTNMCRASIKICLL